MKKLEGVGVVFRRAMAARAFMPPGTANSPPASGKRTARGLEARESFLGFEASPPESGSCARIRPRASSASSVLGGGSRYLRKRNSSKNRKVFLCRSAAFASAPSAAGGGVCAAGASMLANNASAKLRCRIIMTALFRLYIVAPQSRFRIILQDFLVGSLVMDCAAIGQKMTG